MKTKYVFTDVDKVDILLKIFTNNFVRLCNENSITQSRLANAIGCTHETISNYQLGITYPNLENLLKIANFFKITLNELVGMPTITTSIKEESEIRYFAKKTGLSVESINMLYRNYKDESFSCENEALDFLIKYDYIYGFNDPCEIPFFKYLHEAICHPNIKLNTTDKELREKLDYYIDDYYIKQCSDIISVGEFYLYMLNKRINHLVKDVIWNDRKVQRKVKEELRKKPMPSEIAK